jgi:hypothetical protein
VNKELLLLLLLLLINTSTKHVNKSLLEVPEASVREVTKEMEAGSGNS